MSDEIIEKRTEKIVSFLKKEYVWVGLIIIIALILGVYIRIMPLMDHTQGVPSLLRFISGNAFDGRPGLYDITTNTWTLGPDLDPWLFERTAEDILKNNGLPKMDMMRNVPVGLDPLKETVLLPYMIVYTYKLLTMLGYSINMEFAAALLPVIMFALTIIAFFLFTRELFLGKTKETRIKANIIASIATFLMIVTPAFLSRTIAGIPEKESAGFFFMFITFYFILKAWKSEKLRNSIIFAVLAGIATAMMDLIWGGVIYLYIPIGLAVFVAFILNKVGKKELTAYAIWLLLANSLFLLFSERDTITGMLTSLDTGLCYLVLITIVVHLILTKTKLKDNSYLAKIKLPKTIVSFLITLVLIAIVTSIVFGPNFIIDKIKVIHQNIFQPVTGRWNTTVAENRQPYFTEWGASFGPFLKNIPVMFWLFFLGSVLLFKKMTDHLGRKKSITLTLCYVIFFFGIVFSRYAQHPALFDGDGLFSKAFYYGSALLLIGMFLYYYFRDIKEKKNDFEKIEFEYLLILSLFVLTLFTARGAIRLIMVLASVAPVLVGFLVVDSFSYIKKSKDETMKIVMVCFFVVIVLLAAFTINSYYKQIKSEAYSFVPGYYNQQWQKSMEWVRNNTASDAVFAHWWDYGYWVQSIGERATVLDGGNAKVFWNYWMGRLVLTGDNQKDSLDFLYAHDSDYLLIDSTDIGKYGAFSSIGSDKNYDRFSWIGEYVLDEKQTQETSNQTLLVYTGGSAIDEDLILNVSGNEVMLPKQKAGVYAMVIPRNNKNNRFEQPYFIAVYQNKQYQQKLRYLYINGSFIDFKEGIEACAFITPSISIGTDGRVSSNDIGAGMYLSPRLMRGFLAQAYLLNDPFNNFPNFKIAHSQPNFVVETLNSQGMELPDFVYFQGSMQGPIKIWKINYNFDQKVDEKYLETDSSKYLDWKL